jgi:hypothetical protein
MLIRRLFWPTRKVLFTPLDWAQIDRMPSQRSDVYPELEALKIYEEM